MPACRRLRTMAIDIGLDDPAAMEALSRAISIVDEGVDSLHDEIAESRTAMTAPSGQGVVQRRSAR